MVVQDGQERLDREAQLEPQVPPDSPDYPEDLWSPECMERLDRVDRVAFLESKVTYSFHYPLSAATSQRDFEVTYGNGSTPHKEREQSAHPPHYALSPSRWMSH